MTKKMTARMMAAEPIEVVGDKGGAFLMEAKRK
jgi:hypothetical protein